jgi:hypothetical protein
MLVYPDSNDDVQNASTTEKISDGLRAGYEKVTGEHRSSLSQAQIVC